MVIEPGSDLLMSREAGPKLSAERDSGTDSIVRSGKGPIRGGSPRIHGGRSASALRGRVVTLIMHFSAGNPSGVI